MTLQTSNHLQWLYSLLCVGLGGTNFHVIASLQPSSVAVQSGLCRTWWDKFPCHCKPPTILSGCTVRFVSDFVGQISMSLQTSNHPQWLYSQLCVGLGGTNFHVIANLQPSSVAVQSALCRTLSDKFPCHCKPPTILSGCTVRFVSDLVGQISMSLQTSNHPQWLYSQLCVGLGGTNFHVIASLQPSSVAVQSGLCRTWWDKFPCHCKPPTILSGCTVSFVSDLVGQISMSLQASNHPQWLYSQVCVGLGGTNFHVIASLQPSSVAVQSGLCRTLSDKFPCHCKPPTILSGCTVRFVSDLVGQISMSLQASNHPQWLYSQVCVGLGGTNFHVIASLQPSSVAVQSGLCRTWWDKFPCHCKPPTIFSGCTVRFVSDFVGQISMSLQTSNHLQWLYSQVCVGLGGTNFHVIASLQPSSVAVQSGLCRTWWDKFPCHCKPPTILSGCTVRFVSDFVGQISMSLQASNHLQWLYSQLCVGLGGTNFHVIANLQPSSVAVQSALCRTLSDKFPCHCKPPTIFSGCTVRFVSDLVGQISMSLQASNHLQWLYSQVCVGLGGTNFHVIASLQPSSVAVQSALCQTWWDKFPCHCKPPTIFSGCTVSFVSDLVGQISMSLQTSNHPQWLYSQVCVGLGGTNFHVIASLQPSSVAVQSALCQTWWDKFPCHCKPPTIFSGCTVRFVSDLVGQISMSLQASNHLQWLYSQLCVRLGGTNFHVIANLQPSSVAVQSALCRTWWDKFPCHCKPPTIFSGCTVRFVSDLVGQISMSLQASNHLQWLYSQLCVRLGGTNFHVIASLQPSSVAVQSALCRTLWDKFPCHCKPPTIFSGCTVRFVSDFVGQISMSLQASNHLQWLYSLLCVGLGGTNFHVIANLQPSSVAVQSGLCRTWWDKFPCHCKPPTILSGCTVSFVSDLVGQISMSLQASNHPQWLYSQVCVGLGGTNFHVIASLQPSSVAVQSGLCQTWWDKFPCHCKPPTIFSGCTVRFVSDLVGQISMSLQTSNHLQWLYSQLCVRLGGTNFHVIANLQPSSVAVQSALCRTLSDKFPCHCKPPTIFSGCTVSFVSDLVGQISMSLQTSNHLQWLYSQVCVGLGGTNFHVIASLQPSSVAVQSALCQTWWDKFPCHCKPPTIFSGCTVSFVSDLVGQISMSLQTSNHLQWLYSQLCVGLGGTNFHVIASLQPSSVAVQSGLCRTWWDKFPCHCKPPTIFSGCTVSFVSDLVGQISMSLQASNHLQWLYSQLCVGLGGTNFHVIANLQPSSVAVQSALCRTWWDKFPCHCKPPTIFSGCTVSFVSDLVGQISMSLQASNHLQWLYSQVCVGLGGTNFHVIASLQPSSVAVQSALCQTWWDKFPCHCKPPTIFSGCTVRFVSDLVGQISMSLQTSNHLQWLYSQVCVRLGGTNFHVIASLQPSSVAVQSGLCRTWWDKFPCHCKPPTIFSGCTVSFVSDLVGQISMSLQTSNHLQWLYSQVCVGLCGTNFHVIASLQPSSVAVQSGLCRTWWDKFPCHCKPPTILSGCTVSFVSDLVGQISMSLQASNHLQWLLCRTWWDKFPCHCKPPTILSGCTVRFVSDLVGQISMSLQASNHPQWLYSQVCVGLGGTNFHVIASLQPSSVAVQSGLCRTWWDKFPCHCKPPTIFSGCTVRFVSDLVGQISMSLQTSNHLQWLYSQVCVGLCRTNFHVIANLQPSSVAVQSGLCRTWWDKFPCHCKPPTIFSGCTVRFVSDFVGQISMSLQTSNHLQWLYSQVCVGLGGTNFHVIANLQPSSVAVQSGLCRTWWDKFPCHCKPPTIFSGCTVRFVSDFVGQISMSLQASNHPQWLYSQVCVGLCRTNFHVTRLNILRLFWRTDKTNFQLRLNLYIIQFVITLFFCVFLIQFNVPFKIISLIETSQSIGGRNGRTPGKPPDTPASGTWLVSHEASAGLEPTPDTAVR